jgi:PAS domain S-box-containing protein
MVHFCEDEDSLIEIVGDFLGAGLSAQQPALVIATADHAVALRDRLVSKGIAAGDPTNSAFLRLLDAQDTLGRIMVEGLPDEKRFADTVGALVQRHFQHAGGSGLRAYSEMVALLWKQGQREAAIRLEEYWHRLAARHPFRLLCAYSMESLSGSQTNRGLALDDVCRTHANLTYVAAPADLQAENERLHADPTLRESELELRDFFENAVDGMHWVGPDGTILWANAAELDMLGYARHEYVGRHIASFHADQSVIGDILARLWRNEILRDYEAMMRRKDGSLRHVLINSSVYWRNGEFVHTRCVTRDVTEQKRLESQRMRAVRYLTAQHAVARILAEVRPFGQIVPQLLKTIGEVGEWDIGALWTLDATRHGLRCIDVWCAGRIEAAGLEAATRAATFRQGIGLPGRVWASGEAAWLEDIAIDGDFVRAPIALGAGVRSAVAFPIRVRGRITGVLEFFGRNVRARDSELLNLCDATAAQIGNFIDSRENDEVRERLAAIVNSSDDAIVSKTLDGVITSWNRGAEHTFGYTSAEAVGRHISLIIPADRLAEEEEVLARLRRGERIQHYETERQRKDGQRVNVSLSVSPVRDADGRIVGASKVVRDITERKLAQIALAESEERFRILADSAPVLIWVNDSQGGCTFVNKAYLEFFGTTLEDVQGDRWQGRVHPDDVHLYVSHYLSAFERRVPFRCEVRLQRSDGEYRWVESYALPHVSAMGEFLGYVGVSPDITERKNAEEALRASEERARAQVQITAVLNRIGARVASSLDRDDIVQMVTDLATEITTAEFGAFFYNATDPQSGEEFLLYTLSGAPKEAFAGFPKPRATALFGPTFRGEGIVRIDDVLADPRYGRSAPHHGMPAGHLPVRSYLAVPVKSRSGEVLGGLFFGHSRSGVFTDQHEHLVDGIATWASIALENARLHAETERAVQARDEFLSIAAHELRNPLNALQLQLVGLHRASLAAERVVPIDLVCSRLSQATDDVGTLVRLVHNLLDVARITAGRLDLEPEDAAFDEVVRGVLVRFGEQFADRPLEVDLKKVAGRTDRLRFEQVVSNLISNAIKYGEGKPIEVSLQSDDRTVSLSVTDHGIGISAEDQKQLFERFSRAVQRRDYGGFGLGLWIVRETVRAMEGGLLLESQPGKGSTFTVTLPRILNVAHPAAAPAFPAEPATASAESPS